MNYKVEKTSYQKWKNVNTFDHDQSNKLTISMAIFDFLACNSLKKMIK